MKYLAVFTKFISFFFAIFFATTSFSKEKTTITWYMYDLPPYHILRGDYQGQGPLDFAYSRWREYLTEYRHRSVSVNTTRMLREFQSDKDYRCITSSFKFPESKDHWVWSKALYVEPPVVLVTRQDVARRLGNPDTVSLEKLLADQSLTFGHFDGRIYSGEIDKLINQHLNNKNVLSIGSYAPGESLMRMLQRGRIDYVLEYLPEIHWLTLSKQLETDVNLVAINIENHQALSPVYVGCVATDWGKLTISYLNSKITDDLRRSIWKRYKKWLHSDFGIERFLKAQQEYFLTTSE